MTGPNLTRALAPRIRYRIICVYHNGSRCVAYDDEMTEDEAISRAQELSVSVREVSTRVVEIESFRPVVIKTLRSSEETVSRREEKEWSDSLAAAKEALETGGACVRCGGGGRRCHDEMTCGMCGGTGKTRIEQARVLAEIAGRN